MSREDDLKKEIMIEESMKDNISGALSYVENETYILELKSELKGIQEERERIKEIIKPIMVSVISQESALYQESGYQDKIEFNKVLGKAIEQVFKEWLK